MVVFFHTVPIPVVLAKSMMLFILPLLPRFTSTRVHMALVHICDLANTAESVSSM